MSVPSFRRLGYCAAVALIGCTPLGLWVYDDPGLEVSRVRVDHDERSRDPVVLGLAVWNPNDYDVTTARLEVKLKLDDVAVGHFSRDSILPVPQVGLAEFSVPLTVDQPVRNRIRTLSSGTHRFAVEGRAVFSTPFGPRKVRFAHEGDLAFAGANEAKIATTVAADSVNHRARRGIYAPRVAGVRPVPEQGPPPVMREPRSEPR